MAKKSAYLLIFTVIAMLALGIVMLYSIGAFARDAKGDPYFFVKKQALYLMIGLAVMVVGALVDYNFWKKTWGVWFVGSAILLILCFAPGIGLERNGANRWLDLRVTTFQPSEFAKFASVAFLAFWFSKFQAKSGTLGVGFAAPLVLLGVLLGLIVIEVDLGTTVLIGGTAVGVMFVAGTNLFYLSSLGLAGVGGIAYAVTQLEERRGRILAFLDLWKYAETEGHQQIQALLAFGSGGIDGRGLGLGRLKMDYLPEAHTDFIFPMVGEELGLRCTLAVVFGYLLILFCGALISMHARDRFGMLLGFGITCLLTFQAVVNIGVTTALLPNKGLPLPFISYGGSNLMMCLFMLGVLLNIYRQGLANREGQANVLVRERVLSTRI